MTFDDGYRNNLEVAAPELARRGIPALVAVTTDLLGSDRLLWPQELDERVLRWPERELPLPDGSSRPWPPTATAREAFASSLRERCKRLPSDARHDYLERLRRHELELDPWQRELYDFLTWDEVRELAGRAWTIASHTATHPILTQVSASHLEQELQRSRDRIEREVGVDCRALVFPNGGRRDVNAAVLAATGAAGYELGFVLTGGRNRRRPANPSASTACASPAT